MPDEREIAAFGARRMAGRRSDDVQARGDLVLMTLSNGYLITKEIDGVAANVVDLIDVYYIGPVNFQEVGADELFFHVL